MLLPANGGSERGWAPTSLRSACRTSRTTSGRRSGRTQTRNSGRQGIKYTGNKVGRPWHPRVSACTKISRKANPGRRGGSRWGSPGGRVGPPSFPPLPQLVPRQPRKPLPHPTSGHLRCHQAPRSSQLWSARGHQHPLHRPRLPHWPWPGPGVLLHSQARAPSSRVACAWCACEETPCSPLLSTPPGLAPPTATPPQSPPWLAWALLPPPVSSIHRRGQKPFVPPGVGAPNGP